MKPEGKIYLTKKKSQELLETKNVTAKFNFKDWSGTVSVKQPLFLKDWLTALQSALVETVLSKNDIKLPNEYCQIEQGPNLKEQNLNIDFD